MITPTQKNTKDFQKARKDAFHQQLRIMNREYRKTVKPIETHKITEKQFLNNIK